MAEWRVYAKQDGMLGLLYRNRMGQTHKCGELEAAVTERSIVEWVIEKGKADPGDLIVFPNGLTLHVALKGAEA